MKTYLQELRGQVRGNARLRRRLDASRCEIERLKRHIGSLVSLADRAGRGDDVEVVRAAAAIGWVRFTKEQRERIRMESERLAASSIKDDAAMLRQRFLENHFLSLVSPAMDDAEKLNGGDSVVVLCDLSDVNGKTLSRLCGWHDHGTTTSGDAWVACFTRPVLVALLKISWPELTGVIAELECDGAAERQFVLVVSNGGVQLRGGLRAEPVP